MNECEMQIQLRQPPPPQSIPLPSSVSLSSSPPPPATPQAAAAVHRSRLETELNLQKQNHHHHVLDLKTTSSTSANSLKHHRTGTLPVTVAAVQHLLESFDNRIRAAAATTKCVNMSSEQARIAGIPASTNNSNRHVPSPPTNPAAAAALMLLKNRIIPSVTSTTPSAAHNGGLDLSPRGAQRPLHNPGLLHKEPRRILTEQSTNSHNKRTSNSNGNNHIPLTTSAANAVNNNHHSSPSSASSGSSDCHSPSSSNGGGGGGNGGGSTGGGTNGGSGAGLNGSAKAINGGRLQFFKDGKFILELASSREHDNGRPGWVAVPRKIYWPPTAQGFTTYNAPSVAAAASTTTPGSTLSMTAGTAVVVGPTSTGSGAIPPNTNSNHSFQKNESSASLSFSDDNSSIQSSPSWQQAREHYWKQLTPRRSVSGSMCFMYVRPRKWIEVSDRGHSVSLAKRRRPYEDREQWRIGVKDAFQRVVVVGTDKGTVLKGEQVAEEKKKKNKGEDRMTSMETDEDLKGEQCETKVHENEDKQEKTDLGTEKKNGGDSVDVEEVKVKVEVKDEETTTSNEVEPVKRDQATSASSKKDGEDEKMDEGDTVDGGVNKASDKETEDKKTENSNTTTDNELDSNKKTVKLEKQPVNGVDQEEPMDQGERMEVATEASEVVKKESDVEKENPSKSVRRRRQRKRQDLEAIVSNLLTNGKTLVAKLKLASPKLEALMHSQMLQHVSPRKRILREFERVSLDEATSGASGPGSGTSSSSGSSSPGKRHRSKHQSGGGKSGSSSSTFFVPSTGMLMGNGHGQSHSSGSSSNNNSKLATSNGGSGLKDANRSQTLPHHPAVTPAVTSSPGVSKPISSYSIISLLGHNSSGSNNGSSPRTDPSNGQQASSHHLHHQQQQHATNSHHQQQLHNMESMAAAKGMDLQQYNKSLPPKKKLSPPPSSATASWSSPKGGVASSNNTESPMSAISGSSHLMMRSPEMSPSPEHGAGGRAFKSLSSQATASFHPYLNVANRASPSEDLNGNSRYAHHQRSSPHFVRDRHLSGSSPNSRYSPVQSAGSSSSNGKSSSNPPPPAHGAASPYSTSSRPSPMSASSPLSSHYFGSGAATQSAAGSQANKGRRSPSPAAASDRSSSDRYLSQRRLIEEDREAAELNALAMQQQQQQLEFERYAKFYGAAPHNLLGPPVPPHLMMPGAFEHMSEAAAAAAHLMRPSAGTGGPGAPSPAALMSSLHQAAYLMYPPTSGATGPGGPAVGPPGAPPYLSPSSLPYYQQYMAAAAAAAMYGRGSPLWPYMAAGGIPGPPGGSPLRLPPGGGGGGGGLHHSPQHMMQQPGAPARSPMGAREEKRGGGGGGERMSPNSPLALRMRDDGESGRAAGHRDVAMDHSREDPDVPLNLSKH